MFLATHSDTVVLSLSYRSFSFKSLSRIGVRHDVNTRMPAEDFKLSFSRSFTKQKNKVLLAVKRSHLKESVEFRITVSLL